MQFYIDGSWVDPAVKKSIPVVNPATEETLGETLTIRHDSLDRTSFVPGVLAQFAVVPWRQQEQCRWHTDR